MEKGRVIIVDPSLRDDRGHHKLLAQRISEEAVAQGHDVVWVAHADANSNLAKGLATVVPTFTSDMYKSYARPNVLQQIWQNVFSNGSSPEETQEERIRTYGVTLERILTSVAAELAWVANDHVLFHTADGATYTALNALWKRLPAENRAQLCICTPYDPVGVMPNRNSALEVAEAVRELNGVTDSVRFFGENRLLSEHLSAIWDVEVSSLELPVPPPSESAIRRGRDLQSSFLPDRCPHSRVAIALGAARLEKGFHLFPDIVRRVREFEAQHDFTGSPTVFVLQASPQVVGYHPVIKTAIEKLEGLNDPNVVLLKSPLNDLDYEGWLAASDVVLLPYDEEAYKVRGSGIVAEAVAADVPIIAKPNSYPGDVATKNGGTTGTSPLEIARGLVDLMRDYKNRKQLARDYGAKSRERTNAGNYIAAIVGR